ncbi:MAG: PHP domain-containing protein [candidate division KSB1 bacterium]|nr:PHP domain-containing protein [candidate division KSB1 bacterium]MDZ7339833.1 PHP domain-containing protein [candidate division KSB1 bacterium]
MSTDAMSTLSQTTSYVDLHIHSNQSDGCFTAREIIDIAVRRRLKAIAITDHDHIQGLGEAMKYAQQQGMEFITGVEISARAPSFDLHLLGYYFDYRNQQLNEYLRHFQNERLNRARKIIELLKKHGIKLSFDLIQKKAGGAIGRPHIADAMLEEGYIHSYQEAFDKYIGDGCPCCVPKYKISPGEAAALINQAGGVCVIAHPGTDISDSGLLDLIKVGIEGVETIHPRHTPAQVNHYREIVQKYGLLETGGSDCHGDRKTQVLIGHFKVPYSMVEKMKERIFGKHQVSF